MLEPDRQQRERKDLAEALRSLRKAAGLSGERLAARCSMSQSKISRIEQGKILPSVADVQRLLTALKVPDEVARELIDLARTANSTTSSFRAYAQVGLWRAQAEVKAMAEASTVVRQFLPAIPLGCSKQRDMRAKYSLLLFPAISRHNVERTVAARMDSQQVLRDDSRRFLFLMPEHSVRWRRADPQIMVRSVRAYGGGLRTVAER